MLLNIVFNGFTISFLSLHYNMNTKYTIADQSIQKYLLVRHYIRNQCKNLTCNVSHNFGWSLNEHMHRHSCELRLLFLRIIYVTMPKQEFNQTLHTYLWYFHFYCHFFPNYSKQYDESKLNWLFILYHL